MNKLELGVQATATVADAAVVNPGQSANKALVSNGTNWLAQLLVNANIDAAAAIAYSKLALAGSVVNNDIAAGAAIAKSKLASLGIVDADVAAGAAIAASKLAGGLFLAAPQKYGTLIDIVSSIAETDILQSAGYTVPANTLGALGSARVKLRGDFLNNTGGAVTPVIRVYFGGVKIFDWTGNIPSLAASATRRPFRLEFDLANLNATNSQELNGYGYFGAAGALTTGIGGQDSLSGAGGNGVFADMEATSAIDTTAGCLLRVTAQLSSSSASHELRVRSSLIEFI